MNRWHAPVWILGTGTALALSACGGGTQEAAIGGAVSGLSSGSSVTLAENSSTILSVTGSAAFEFPGALPANTPYVVTVASQPPGATCSVANGSGTMDSDGVPINDVMVSCAPGTTVGGSVTGLQAGSTLTLSDGISTLPVTANGPYAFTDLYANAAPYAVSVSGQPSNQFCSVSNASGAIDANGDAVSNVNFVCGAVPALGGTVVGLAAGTSVTLADVGSTVSVGSNGSYAFTDSYAPSAVYQVNVVGQPSGQTCTAANAAGQFDGNADPIGNVTISCTTNGSVGGTITGLATGGNVTLTDGNTTLAVTANGNFAFTDLYAPGAVYSISVLAQPNGQTCTITGGTGSGALDANDDAVTTVSITCM